LRIIFLGMPDFVTICIDKMLNADKNIVAVILPPENHPAYACTRSVCQQRNIDFISYKGKINNPEVIKEIKSYNPDIMLMAAFPDLLPPDIYTIPPLGTINCHPSLLPQYRGANPYFHVIRNGETETGVTFHYTDKSFDTGDIIHQEKVPLLSNETIGTLYLRLAVVASGIFVELVTRIENGEKLIGVVQQAHGKILKKAIDVFPGDNNLKINWQEGVLSIDRLIRAANPFYGAHCFFRGALIKIYSGYYKDNEYMDEDIEPGRIVKVTDDELGIAANKTIYYPTCLQAGTLYMSDIKGFIKRNNPKIGETLN